MSDSLFDEKPLVDNLPTSKMKAEKAKKDWKGNSVAYSKTLGASSHCDHDRPEMDYYATEPKAVRLLLELEKFEGKIWECACGEGHLSEEIKKHGYEVRSSDIIDRKYSGRGDCENGEIYDFLSIENTATDMNIITNPPYAYADDFIVKGMEILQEGKKLALFMPIRYLEGKARKKIFAAYPPKTVYVSSSRLKCAMNGDFENMKGSAVSYAWYVWVKGYKGDTILKWFN